MDLKRLILESIGLENHKNQFTILNLIDNKKLIFMNDIFFVTAEKRLFSAYDQYPFFMTGKTLFYAFLSKILFDFVQKQDAVFSVENSLLHNLLASINGEAQGLMEQLEGAWEEDRLHSEWLLFGKKIVLKDPLNKQAICLIELQDFENLISSEIQKGHNLIASISPPLTNLEFRFINNAFHRLKLQQFVTQEYMRGIIQRDHEYDALLGILNGKGKLFDTGFFKLQGNIFTLGSRWQEFIDVPAFNAISLKAL